MIEILVGLQLTRLIMNFLFAIGFVSLIAILAILKYVGNKKEKELTNENKDGKLK